MTCGEALLHLLAQYNVDTIFGIPGAHSLELYRGIATQQLRYIQARHEQGAGFMADGYARVSGKCSLAHCLIGNQRPVCGCLRDKRIGRVLPPLFSRHFAVK